jgi:hypothetical protein
MAGAFILAALLPGFRTQQTGGQALAPQTAGE